jgi:hypothetical protein
MKAGLASPLPLTPDRARTVVALLIAALIVGILLGKGGRPSARAAWYAYGRACGIAENSQQVSDWYS